MAWILLPDLICPKPILALTDVLVFAHIAWQNSTTQRATLDVHLPSFVSRLRFD